MQPRLLLMMALAAVAMLPGCSWYQSFRQTREQDLRAQYANTDVREQTEAREPD
jgi:hypothetical protein